MRRLLPLIPLLLFAVAPAGAEEPPPVRVERVEEILAKARPVLEKATGLPWPEALEVEATDPAGLHDLLLDEFETEVAALHPERPASSRRILAETLARAFARVVRAKYGLATKKIHVAAGALERLPEGVAPDDALVYIVVHEAVHAMDDAAVPLAAAIRTASEDPERLRALRMVIEGRAEHYGAIAAAALGVDPGTGPALIANRDAGERLTRDAGRAFVAALDAKEEGTSLAALRSPPATTSVVFHPERWGDPPPEDDLRERLAAALPAARVEPLSELLLRKAFLSRLGAESVDRAFAGFVRGFAATARDGRRVSLVAAEDEASATAFLAGVLSLEGAEAAGEDGVATKEIVLPDGRHFPWAAAARGAHVAEAVVPPGGDAAALVRAALEK